MPGYKQSEVGVIPEDWGLEHIESIATVTTGAKNTQDRIKDGQYPFFVRSQTIERINSFSFDGEAVLTAGDGVGTGKVFHYINGRFDVHQRVYRISNFSERVNGYFFFLYFSTHFYNRIMQMTAKSSVDSVRRDMITRMLVPLPPTETEQRAIVTALRDVDALLLMLDELIAKKRDLWIGVMQRLLTGETRLPGFTDPWQEKRLGDHVSFLRNGTHSRAQLTVGDPVRNLHYGDIHAASSIRLDVSRAMMPRLSAAAAARLTRLEDGDVVFIDASEDLVGVGKSLEIEGASIIEAVAGQHTIAARFDKEVLADGFKGYLQFVPTFIAHLRRLAAGTKVYATNRKHIASAEIALPEPDEQRAIARVLSDMEAEIAGLDARLGKTRDLKQAMMQALLTGRVRLPVSAVEIFEPEAAHA